VGGEGEVGVELDKLGGFRGGERVEKGRGGEIRGG